MIKIIIFQLVFCSIFISDYALADLPKILFPGNVQDVDLPNYGKGLNGANFLALHKVKNKFFISRAKVKYDPSYEAANANNNISSSIDNTIALFRYSKIKTGEVNTATTKLRVTMTKTEILLNGQTYYVQETNHGLSLTGQEGEALIVPNRVTFYIIWAGDLDRDGRLDLIVESDDGDEKNSMSCLLLSSIAKKNELVKEYACQFYSG